MSVKVESVETLRRYFRGVVSRSEDHGRGVDEVVFALLGLVLVYMDDESDISVRGSEGSEGNILWFQVRGKRYAFRYEHSDGTIELRAEKHTGHVISKYSNKSTIGQMKADFGNL